MVNNYRLTNDLYLALLREGVDGVGAVVPRARRLTGAIVC